MQIINFEQKELWDEIVSSFKEDNLYYSREYLSSFLKIDKSSAKLIFFEGKGIRLMYAMQIYDIGEAHKFVGKIQKNKYFDMTSPYGYGGPVFEGENTQEIDVFFKELYKYSINNNIVSQFIRFNPITDNQKIFMPFMDVITEKQTQLIYLEQEEQLWVNIISKNKNMIRKALKMGVNVEICETEKGLESFQDMYKSTMERLKADNYYYFNEDFFKSIKSDLSEKIKIFVAKYEDKVICSDIILLDIETLHYHLSASTPEDRGIPANNLLLYEIAKWGLKNGYKRFHLGGGIKAEDNLYRFKKSFGGQEKDFCIGRNIFMPESFNQLIDIREKTDPEFNRDAKYLIKYRL